MANFLNRTECKIFKSTLYIVRVSGFTKLFVNARVFILGNYIKYILYHWGIVKINK